LEGTRRKRPWYNLKELKEKETRVYLEGARRRRPGSILKELGEGGQA